MRYKNHDRMMTYVKAFCAADSSVYIPNEIWIFKIFPYLDLNPSRIDSRRLAQLRGCSAATTALYLSVICSSSKEEAEIITYAYDYCMQSKGLQKFYKNSVPAYLLPNVISPMQSYVSISSKNNYKKDLKNFLNTVELEYLKNYRADVAVPFIGGGIELEAIAKIWNCKIELKVHHESGYFPSNHTFKDESGNYKISVTLNLKRTFNNKCSIAFINDVTQDVILMDVFTAFSEAYNSLNPALPLSSSYVKGIVEQFLYREYLSANEKDNKHYIKNKKIGSFSSIHKVFETYIFKTSMRDKNVLFDLIPECEIKEKARHLHHRLHNISNSFIDEIYKQIDVNHTKTYILDAAKERMSWRNSEVKCKKIINITMRLYVLYPYIFILNILVGVGYTYAMFAVSSLEKYIKFSVSMFGAIPLYLSYDLFLSSVRPYCEMKTECFENLRANLPPNLQHTLTKCNDICDTIVINTLAFMMLGIIGFPALAWLLPPVVTVVVILIQYVIVFLWGTEIFVTKHDHKIAQSLRDSLVEFHYNQKNITSDSVKNYELYGVDPSLIKMLEHVPVANYVLRDIFVELIGCNNYLQSLIDDPSFRNCMTSRSLEKLYENLRILNTINADHLKSTSGNVVQLSKNTDELITILNDREKRINNYQQHNSKLTPQHDSLSECLRHISSSLIFTRIINEPLVNEAANVTLGQRHDLAMNMV